MIAEEKLQQLEVELAPFLAMLEVEIGAMRVLHFTGERPRDATLAWDWNLSLAKWVKLVRELQSGRIVRSGGWATCGLCMRFWHLAGCRGCPIREATGRGACDGTPYDRYLDEMDRHEKRPTALLQAATDQLAFLLDLCQEWRDQIADSPHFIWKGNKPNE